MRQHGQAQREHGQFSPLRVYHRLRLPAICRQSLYYAVDDRGRKFQASTVLRLSDPQLGELIHWLHYHLKGSNPPPALYHLEMLLQSLEYLRGGRHYLYNSIYEITRLEAYP